MYTKKTLIENYLGTTLSANLDAFIVITIGAVQNYIENYCGDDVFGKRVFEAPKLGTGEVEVDKIRYFDGNKQIKIFIGEAVEVNGLEVDNYSQTQNEDYFLKPYNAIDIGRPFEFIELAQPSGNRSSRAQAIYDFTNDQRNIKVTGKFRYSNVAPSDIQLVATQLAGEMLSEVLDDGIKAETFDDYKVEYASVTKRADELGVHKILDQYKRKLPEIKTGVRLAE